MSTEISREGRGQIQNGGHPHRVELSNQRSVRLQTAPAQAHRNGKEPVGGQIDRQGEHLADAGGQCGPRDAQFREGAGAEDEQGVQDDVGDASGQKGGPW